MSALLLVSHGSRDPQGVAAIEALHAAVSAALPDDTVALGHLDLCQPRVGDTIAALLRAGHRDLVVQPLLFTQAFHATNDVPQAVVEALAGHPEVSVRTAEVLAPDTLLLDALDRQLAATGHDPDALVLASAGTSSAPARAALQQLAQSWSARHGAPGVSAYASAAAPDTAAAVRELMSAGAQRVVVGALFVAPGLLLTKASELALQAGALAVTAPLFDTPQMVQLLVRRFEATRVERVRSS